MACSKPCASYTRSRKHSSLSPDWADIFLVPAFIISVISCVVIAIAGVVVLVRGEVITALIGTPIAFIQSAALAIVSERARKR